MPQPSRPRPAWATALRVRRAELGKSQEQVALDSSILNQTTVSELEGGRYDLANLTVARLAGLARGLDWSLAEMEASLGVDFGLGNYEEVTPARSAPAPQRLRPLPQGLQDAVDAFGKRFPDLLNPVWQQYLAGFQWRRGVPDDPNAWLDLYRDLDRAGVVPGEE